MNIELSLKGLFFVVQENEYLRFHYDDGKNYFIKFKDEGDAHFEFSKTPSFTNESMKFITIYDAVGFGSFEFAVKKNLHDDPDPTTEEPDDSGNDYAGGNFYEPK